MERKKKEIKQPKPLPAPNSDFYDLRSTFSAEEKEILKQVREFLDTKVAPIISKYWLEDAFPFELLPPLKELNIGGVGIEGFGGRGGNLWVLGSLAGGVARGGPSLPTVFGVPTRPSMGSIFLCGFRGQKKKRL